MDPSAVDAENAEVGSCRTQLLDLPQGLLAHVVSWCGDKYNASVNALLATCQTLHALRRLPFTAALLLVRCPAYCTALLGTPEISPHIAHPAVPAAILQLLHACPDAGGPHTASPELLQGLLFCAAWHCNLGLLRFLHALPANSPGAPPLRSLSQAGPGLMARAISQGCSLEVVELMLDLGADPLHDGSFGKPLVRAAAASVPLAILRRLPQHCPHEEPPQPPPQVRAGWIGSQALYAALTADNAAAVALLHPLSRMALPAVMTSAIALVRPAVVQWLAASQRFGRDQLSDALDSVCRSTVGEPAVKCAQALLEHGAQIRRPQLLAEAVVYRRVGLVEVLLRFGAVATAEMVVSAETYLTYDSQHRSNLPSLALAALLRQHMGLSGAAGQLEGRW